MECSYDYVMNWMKDYFDVYSVYGQDIETACKMNEYLEKDLKFVPYISSIKGSYNTREDLLKYTTAHPSCYEKLTPLDIVIDMKRMVAVALLNLEVIDQKTGKIMVSKKSLAEYHLIQDDKCLKICKIVYFWEVLEPGSLEVADVFKRDLR